MMKNKKIFYGIIILIVVGFISIFTIIKTSQENQEALPTSTTADEWGPIQNGIKTRLIPLQQEYILGQPMLFRLEMTNVGSSLVMYDSQQVGVNFAMKIKGPDGKMASYIYDVVQTLGGPQPINAGETVILFDQFDITSQYYLGELGKYTVQFRGQDRAFGEVPIPESNILEIEVQPGNLSYPYLIAGRLLDILPEEWILTMTTRIKVKVTPLGRQSTEGIQFHLVRPAGYKVDVVSIGIWQTDNVVDLSTEETTYISEYLGKNTWGHVYVFIPSEAKTLWPNVREQIMKALEVT